MRKLAWAALAAAGVTAFGLLLSRRPGPFPERPSVPAAPTSTAKGGPSVAGGGPLSPSGSPAPALAPAPLPAAGGAAPPPGPPEDAPLDGWADPSRLTAEQLEARRQHRLEATRRASEAYRQYPPHSRPMRENEELLVPEQIAPTVRPLADPGHSGPDAKTVVRQTQDRLYLRPGTVATVGLEASAGEEPVPIHVTSAVLVLWAGEPPVASAPILLVSFSAAGPGLAASFEPPAGPLRGYHGELLLRVEAEAGTERGSLDYAFIYTGDPPARFTGVVRDRLEAGSVVFGAGVEVLRPGRYRVQGRIDDSTGRPLALARYDGDLGEGRLELPLVLFGKIARDEGGIAPFVLRDVEGFRLLDGVYPDRETMETWRGPYRSRAYRADELSLDAWDGSAGPAPRP